MKNFFLNLFFLVLLISLNSCANNEVKLLLGGSGLNKVIILDKSTQTIEWEHPLEKGWECNSVAFTPRGNVLFSYGKGAMEVDKEHNVIWNIKAPETCELQTARVLKNGNYLLAWAGHPSVIIEADENGKILSRTEYETGIESSHNQFRQIVKEKNNYLIGVMGTSEVREISAEGKVLSTIKGEGNIFTILVIENNIAWLACGDAHKLMKVDMTSGEILKVYNENDIPGVKLCFVAGLVETKNGGLYVCNWQGHSKKDNDVSSLIELDKEGNVIWKLDPKITTLISSVDIDNR